VPQPPVTFVGATDSAAPCAVLLHLAEKISAAAALTDENPQSKQIPVLIG
jgi:hypothetical protein